MAVEHGTESSHAEDASLRPSRFWWWALASVMVLIGLGIVLFWKSQQPYEYHGGIFYVGTIGTDEELRWTMRSKRSSGYSSTCSRAAHGWLMTVTLESKNRYRVTRVYRNKTLEEAVVELKPSQAAGTLEGEWIEIDGTRLPIRLRREGELRVLACRSGLRLFNRGYSLNEEYEVPDFDQSTPLQIKVSAAIEEMHRENFSALDWGYLWESFTEDFARGQFHSYVARDVVWSRDNLLQFELDQSSFTGGAHGLATTSAECWSLDAAGELQTPDFIDNVTDQAIRDALEADLKIQGASWVVDSSSMQPEVMDSSLVLTPEWAIFYYPPYSVGPYSDGAFVVRLPAKQLFEKQLTEFQITSSR